jgi:GxxExxY protein
MEHVNEKYKYSEETAAIIACAIEVHKEIGNGFQEVIYQRALSIEMNLRGISHVREQEMDIIYKGEKIGRRRVDFLVGEKICVELKAVSLLDDMHLAQAINYLEAFNLEVGLLINFGSRSLEFKRVMNKKYKPLPSNPTLS